MVRLISEIENSLEINELRSEIVAKRNQGEVVFEIRKIIPDNNIQNSENPTDIIDLFVNQLGYSSLGFHWKKVNQEEAQKTLIFTMTKDLAYSVQLMSLQEAERILFKLLNFFSGNCIFFTNASFVNNYSRISTWNSLTKATFDTGIVILNDRQIGILWVKDED